MISTQEEIFNDSPSLPTTQTTVKKQVLVNNCVYSLTYWMLKRELISVVLELQNKNTHPLKL